MTTHRGYTLPLAPAHYRVLRELAGLTQQEVAARFDVTDRSARRWEATQPAPDDIARFVIDRWVEVRTGAAGMAAATGDRGLLPMGSTGAERAGARLAVALIELDGRTVEVEGR